MAKTVVGAADSLKSHAERAAHAAQRAAAPSRDTAEALVARAGDSVGGDRSSVVRAAAAVACAAGVGFLVWWLARAPRDGAANVLPVQPVPPA